MRLVWIFGYVELFLSFKTEKNCQYFPCYVSDYTYAVSNLCVRALECTEKSHNFRQNVNLLFPQSREVTEIGTFRREVMVKSLKKRHLDVKMNGKVIELGTFRRDGD